MTTELDLDVDSPEKVAPALRLAARRYFESAGELESAWQEKAPGVPWVKIARILEDAARKIDRAIA